MALNKFMHPRNKYRKPPDFKALAIKYPDFRKYAKQDISGKVSLNFKDLNSVRALTITLLMEDFGLNVDIPPSRLIPTLPLRLNYLLWLEDLLQYNKRQADDIKGIDIGCGASCVYPLLAAKQFGWKMIGTEVDSESAFVASGNVKRNKLQDKIRVRIVEEGTMLVGIMEPDTVYDFCMCNPPFFSSVEELDPQHVARSLNRPLPRNAHSGATGELVVPGGEIAFVNKIIEDSLKLKEIVRIYSVMVGHKTSVGKVRQSLLDAGVPDASIVTSEFCQGRTTRWGVAWTLDPHTKMVTIKNSPDPHKKNTPLSHHIQLDFVTVIERLKQLMVELQITYTTLKKNDELCAMEISAMSNTWSNSRKKRRAEKLKQQNKGTETVRTDTTTNTESGDIEKNASGSDITTNNGEQIVPAETIEKESINIRDNVENPVSDCAHIEERTTVTGENKNEDHNSTLSTEGRIEENKNKRPCDEEGSSNTQTSKKPKMEGSSVPFFVGSLIAHKSGEETKLELIWVRGLGGKDSAHQVLQYFKNNLKCNK